MAASVIAERPILCSATMSARIDKAISSSVTAPIWRGAGHRSYS
jgi:hypothetical protein